MPKRRLSQQQKRRIAAKQQVRRESLDSPQDALNTPLQPGLVISHLGKHLLVEATDGSQIHCDSRQNLGSVVTGDRVIWQGIEENRGVVVSIEPRTSFIERKGAYKTKALAANVTQLVIVCALNPKPQSCTIDRYMVLAYHLGLNPILIVNKWDLIDEQEWFNERIHAYQQIGIPVFTTSQECSFNSKLLQTLNDQISILVGQSGVGKSSLLNRLQPAAMAETGEISEQKGLGRHTTTTTKLYRLPNGGSIIDSPGIRQFQFLAIEPSQLFNYFPEFTEYAGQCGFRNCKHLNEPDCALLAAAQKGKIAPFRLDSYTTIYQECVEQQQY